MPKIVGWHKEDIKAAIRKRGITLEKLSTNNGLFRQACSNALNKPFFAAEMVIAEFLGVSPRQIWPHRYRHDGSYRHPKTMTHYMRHGCGCTRQNTEAA